MRFDYNIGTEATFNDWVLEGIEKAQMILDELDKSKNDEKDKQDLN
ncbi:MAG: hypothetical protein ACI4EA_03850 [Candidatus Ornithomonoglobus sp.]